MKLRIVRKLVGEKLTTYRLYRKWYVLWIPMLNNLAMPIEFYNELDAFRYIRSLSKNAKQIEISKTYEI